MKYGKKLPLSTHRTIEGYTQESFAEAIGVDRTTVAFWETGRSHPNRENVAKIEALLGIKWADDILVFKP